MPNDTPSPPAGPRRPAPLIWCFVALLLLCLLTTYFIDHFWLPYAEWPSQWLSYHDFADGRSLLGLPNGLDVLSNLPFLLVGLLGLRLVHRTLPGPTSPYRQDWERRGWRILFWGVLLTGFGSGYYHLWPDNVTLFWDRLPMAIVFMAFLALVVGERLSPALGRRLLWLLQTVGIGSVVYWELSEIFWRGDLRPYLLVQFVPLLLLPLLLLCRSPYSHGRGYLYLFICYGLAKILEVYDRQLFDLTGGLVSGHSLKHLAAAAASFCLYRMLIRRRPRKEKPPAEKPS